MAANRAGLETGKESKQENNSGQTIPDKKQINSFKDCVSALLGSITEFGSEVGSNDLFCAAKDCMC